MRTLAVLGLAAAALAIAPSVPAGASGRTALSVTYWDDPSADPVRWTLRCNPARGTLPRPRVACRKLAAEGAKLFTPIPPDTVCTQIYGGPQRARVVGTVAGRRVWATFSREDGCRIARWNRLSPWLLPAGGVRS